jgi:hypothetical protein
VVIYRRSLEKAVKIVMQWSGVAVLKTIINRKPNTQQRYILGDVMMVVVFLLLLRGAIVLRWLCTFISLRPL